MSDLFISYSRKDIAFARLLHEAMKENGFETWIDWQDIPPTVDWLKEVYTAIEESDTFIFILSSSSSLSEICQLEIEHARKNNKRLIPIVINNVNPSEVHPVLAAINWIFSRTKDEFQPAIADLITAIQTDFDWVKTHTRLQIRSLEWERSNYDKSFLLRGSDLSQAENWISIAAEKSPEPTLLQTQFLQTSRQEATKRQRNLLFGVGLALVVSAVLGVLAVINGNRANSNAISLSTQVVVAQNAEATAQQESFSRATQQSIAEEQRNIAVARQLAAQSIIEVENHYDLSLLLGIESANLSSFATWANGNLLTLLQSNPHLTSIMRGHIDSVSSVAYSPNGKLVASGSFDHSILLWDVTNPSKPTSIGEPLTGHSDIIWDIAFSPDGNLLASASFDDSIILWDVSDPENPNKLSQTSGGHIFDVRSVAFSPDGKYLASCSGDFSIIIWDISSPDEIKLLSKWIPYPFESEITVTFSPDGKFLASAGEANDISLWYIKNPESHNRLYVLKGHTDYVYCVRFSSDGSLIASGSADGSIIIWSINESGPPEKISTIQINEEITSLEFSPDNNFIAFGTYNHSIEIWDISQPSLPSKVDMPFYGHSSAIEDISFNPEGTMLASGSWDKTVILWDLNQPTRLSGISTQLTDHTDWVGSVDFNTTGNLLASGSKDESIILWDMDNPQEPELIQQFTSRNSDVISSVKFINDGSYLAAGSWNRSIVFWNIEQPDKPIELNHTLWGHQGKVSHIDVNSSRNLLISQSYEDSANPIKLHIYDLDNMYASDSIDVDVPDAGHSSAVISISLSPDGTLLASGGKDNTIIFWDLTDLYNPIQLSQINIEGEADSLAFSPDGQTLAIGSNFYSVILWNLEDLNNPIPIGQPLIGHKYVITDLEFSLDGQILASASADDTIILWDMSTPESPTQFGIPITGHTGDIEGISFSPDSRYLASGADDNTVIIWDLSVKTWIEFACQLAGRNLTPDEWKQYLPFDTYQKTCPEFP